MDVTVVSIRLCECSVAQFVTKSFLPRNLSVILIFFGICIKTVNGGSDVYCKCFDICSVAEPATDIFAFYFSFFES
jgi:hypothetical protein